MRMTTKTAAVMALAVGGMLMIETAAPVAKEADRKSTRLNSSH